MSYRKVRETKHKILFAFEQNSKFAQGIPRDLVRRVAKLRRRGYEAIYSCDLQNGEFVYYASIQRLGGVS